MVWMASYRKEVKKLLKDAEEQGWRVEKKKAGWMLYSPDGVTKVMIHKTASDHRALDNAISLMRPGGFDSKER
jgi:hypothetical protein